MHYHADAAARAAYDAEYGSCGSAYTLEAASAATCAAASDAVWAAYKEATND
jgi:hypothetical protein